MFEYIKGIIIDIYDDKLIIETNGIGYLIKVSLYTSLNLAKGTDAIMYIHENIREDEITLYGFVDMNEREVFRDLIGVSGIGPKVALGILSKFTPEELQKYITMEDVKALSSAPGIGKKTANRMILELKDKFKHYVSLESDGDISVNNTLRGDGISALMSLGYDYSESSALIDNSIESDITLEELIRRALASKKV